MNDWVLCDECHTEFSGVEIICPHCETEYNRVGVESSYLREPTLMSLLLLEAPYSFSCGEAYLVLKMPQSSNYYEN